MASALLRRHLVPKPTLFRSFSTSPARWKPEVQSTAKGPFDTHTVEDLHGMSASEILAETGTRADTKLRHFTGAFCDFFVPFVHLNARASSQLWVSVYRSLEDRSLRLRHSPQHPAAHGVLRMILELNGEEILRADPVRSRG